MRVILLTLLLSGCTIPPIIPVWKPKASGSDQSQKKTYNIKFGGKTTAAEGALAMKMLLDSEGKLEKAEAVKLDALARANAWKLWAMRLAALAAVLLIFNFFSGGLLWKKYRYYMKKHDDLDAIHKKDLERGQFKSSIDNF